ncbi:hypothetical protein ACFRCI_44605 [Streptomyces sp. NPDC056638]|uniref:hypothetical protein n=1 Tax=Streptomyces sp. NPDC056638 TaxID=3345887 RepID=UPI0036A6F824
MTFVVGAQAADGFGGVRRSGRGSRAAASTNWSWATFAASRAAVSCSLVAYASRSAYASVIISSATARTA